MVAAPIRRGRFVVAGTTAFVFAKLVIVSSFDFNVSNYDENKLKVLKEKSKKFATPDAAKLIAQALLNLIPH